MPCRWKTRNRRNASTDASSTLVCGRRLRPIPYAPAQLEMRATITGAVPLVPGLSYRASLNVIFGDRSTSLVGPGIDAVPQLAPVDPVRTTLGLQYEF